TRSRLRPQRAERSCSGRGRAWRGRAPQCEAQYANDADDLQILAETKLDLLDSDRRMGVRLFKPQEGRADEWACTLGIDASIDLPRTIHGVSSMQALILALKTLSEYLHGSEEYRAGRIGSDGEFGGDLGF